MSYISSINNFNPDIFKDIKKYNGLSEKSEKLLSERGVTNEEKNTLDKILQKASDLSEKGKFSTNLCYKPMKILNTMSKTDLKILKKAHKLPDDINIDELDYEQAYNLLTEPGAAQDLDEDGYIGLGNGKVFDFPPADASNKVKLAWEKATAGKTEKEILAIKLSMIPKNSSANIKYDEEKKPIGIYKEEDSDYVNIYSQKGFDYKKMMYEYKSNLNLCKYLMSDSNYSNKMDFANMFSSYL